MNVGIACATGARLVDWVPVRDSGSACIKVTYIPKAEADELTEVLCPGDVPSVGGTPMGELDLYRVIDGEWVRHG
ncbi:hypothetical protein [Nocardioides caricicola]|uniref:Uncharacterized protein n=1 Tax=Nocardioides caricicola TaxID=634770 RepID=A0ABW0N6Q9_9ACTN